MAREFEPGDFIRYLRWRNEEQRKAWLEEPLSFPRKTEQNTAITRKWRSIALLGWFLAIALGMSQLTQAIISPSCPPAEVRRG